MRLGRAKVVKALGQPVKVQAMMRQEPALGLVVTHLLMMEALMLLAQTPAVRAMAATRKSSAPSSSAKA